MINLAKKTGTETAIDDVENGVIPPALQKPLILIQKPLKILITSVMDIVKVISHG